MLSMNTIICQDCLVGMRDVPSHSVDLIFTDLPYGITARNKWDTVIPFDLLWAEWKRIIKDHGAIILFASGMFTADLMASNRSWWRYNLIWHKTTPTGFLNANRMPLRAHEDLCVFYKHLPTYHPQKTYGHARKVSTAHHKRNSKATTNYGEYTVSTYDSTERYPTSVLTFKTDKQKSALHPTQKPLALCEYIIRTYTNEGDVVCDCCTGSGSIPVACIQANRNFIAFEIDVDMAGIAQSRIYNHLCIDQNSIGGPSYA